MPHNTRRMLKCASGFGRLRNSTVPKNMCKFDNTILELNNVDLKQSYHNWKKDARLLQFHELSGFFQVQQPQDRRSPNTNLYTATLEAVDVSDDDRIKPPFRVLLEERSAHLGLVLVENVDTEKLAISLGVAPFSHV